MTSPPHPDRPTAREGSTLAPGAVEPGGTPPEETPPGEASATADLAATNPEERARGWAATPTAIILASALLVTVGLLAMAVSLLVT